MKTTNPYDIIRDAQLRDFVARKTKKPARNWRKIASNVGFTPETRAMVMKEAGWPKPPGKLLAAIERPINVWENADREMLEAVAKITPRTHPAAKLEELRQDATVPFRWRKEEAATEMWEIMKPYALAIADAADRVADQLDKADREAMATCGLPLPDDVEWAPRSEACINFAYGCRFSYTPDAKPPVGSRPVDLLYKFWPRDTAE